jgi:hypothetical protein
MRALILEYLKDEYGQNRYVKEIQKINADRKEKHKGRTPLCWGNWLGILEVIENDSGSVPDDHRTDAAGKRVTKDHIGAFLGASSGWVSSCFAANKKLTTARRKNKPAVTALLGNDDLSSAVGIDTFTKNLKAVK